MEEALARSPAGGDTRNRAHAARFLRAVAAISGVYDVLLGLALLFGRPLLMAAFALPAPSPPIHADLNGLFLVAVGLGYWLPWRDPGRYRGYLWVMGPGLKGAGAALFLIDHLVRSSPSSYLVFAATDGILAGLTWWGLGRR
ncbi:MAG TPA: hypothetical protein VK911_18005 [Vicinamibacterales bacterium]|nr:hypothetical protein [Vicinamibacterales bacterium]